MYGKAFGTSTNASRSSLHTINKECSRCGYFSGIPLSCLTHLTREKETSGLMKILTTTGPYRVFPRIVLRKRAELRLQRMWISTQRDRLILPCLVVDISQLGGIRIESGGC